MKIHFIGIGGIGISALARIFKNQGHEVSGSDANRSALTDDLEKLGIRFYEKHEEGNLEDDVEMVIYTEAIPEDNPELKKARELGMGCLTYFQALGKFSEDYRVIAIAGAHGKTTTTAMTALSLIEGGLDPNVIIGTKVEEFGNRNVRIGKSDYLVVEACEYRESFLNLTPEILVITNIEAEHLDYYKTEERYFEAFAKLCQKVPEEGYIIVPEHETRIDEVLGGVRATVVKCRIRDDELWMMSKKAMSYELRAVSEEIPLEGDKGGVQPKEEQAYDTKQGANTPQPPQGGLSAKLPVLQVPGEHYRIDAGLAMGVGLLVGAAEEDLQRALRNFKGTWRRFEKKGEKDGVIVIDDYAHHPTEIQATLKGARELFDEQRIVCVYQPHQYSRTKLLFNDFVQSFVDCDEVIVPNIYRVRDTDEDVASVSPEQLVESIDEFSGNATYGDGFENTVELLQGRLKSGDVLITMGAGPVHEVGEAYLVD